MAKKPVGNDEELQNKWKKRYEIASANQEPKFKRIAQWYDIFYTVYDDSKPAVWRSKVVFPTLGAKSRALIAKMVGPKPGLIPTVQNGEAEIPDDLKAQAIQMAQQSGLDPDKAVEKLEEAYQQKQAQDNKEQVERIRNALEWDWDCPYMDEPMYEKLEGPLMDAIVGGVGIGKDPWVSKKRERMQRNVDDTGMADLTQETVYSSTVGYNEFIPVMIFNLFIAPSATSLQAAPWVIIREFKTLDELKATNDEMGGKFYTNLNSLEGKEASADPQAVYKQSRNRITGSVDPISADSTLKQYAIYECYEKSSKKIYTFAESGRGDGKLWTVLREVKNPYWHGQYPLVPFYVQKRPHDFWGLGIFETNHRLDAAKNSLFNNFVDQYNLSTNKGIITPENSLVDEFIPEPGFTIEYKGDTAPVPFDLKEPDAAQMQVVLATLDKEIEGNSISSYAAGNPNSETDATQGTATGIARIQDAAGDVIGYFRTNYKQSLKLFLNHWLSNRQQFMAAPQTLLIQGKNGKEPVQVSPADFQAQIELDIDDESLNPVSKADQRNDFVAGIQQITTLQQASFTQAQMAGTKPLVLDFKSLAAEIGDKFSMPDLERFIMSDQDVEELQQQQQQVQQAAQDAQAQQQAQLQAGTQQQAQAAQDQQAQAQAAKAVAPHNDATRRAAAELVGAGQLHPSVMEQLQ